MTTITTRIWLAVRSIHHSSNAASETSLKRGNGEYYSNLRFQSIADSRQMVPMRVFGQSWAQNREAKICKTRGRQQIHYEDSAGHEQQCTGELMHTLSAECVIVSGSYF